MRAGVSASEVHSPRCLAEGLELLAGAPNDWKPLAGGTDLMLVFSAGKLANRRFMNIWQPDELRGICVEENAITLGALTTYSDVLHPHELRSPFRLLAAAAAEPGGLP